MYKRGKKGDFKTSHKIILTVLSFVGMMGLAFGVFIFLVFGIDNKSQADTQQMTTKSETNQLADDTLSESKTAVMQKTSAKMVQTSQTTPAKAEVSSDQVTYTVQSGDTLEAISEKFQTSIPSIMQQNALMSPDAIYVGQVLSFLRSYIVKAEPVTPTTGAGTATSAISVHNGNKVAAGGLSEADRTYVLSELQSRTGVDASQWDYIISRESGWIATIKNSIGYYGLFQLAPGYPGYEGDLQAQIEGAVYLFNNGGMTHWAL